MAMAAAGIEVLDVLVATDRRWWSLCCEQPGCCPSEGNQRLPGSSVAAAQAIFAGLVALPDRGALLASLAGDEAEERSALLPLLDEAERQRAAVPAEISWPGGDAQQIARLFGAVQRAPAASPSSWPGTRWRSPTRPSGTRSGWPSIPAATRLPR